MQSRKGSLSIESENMFPIIKKWLYSDHDIFIRELVSNGCDAITKLKKLDIMESTHFLMITSQVFRLLLILKERVFHSLIPVLV